MLFGGIENGHASMQVREQRSKGRALKREAGIHPSIPVYHSSVVERQDIYGGGFLYVMIPPLSHSS